MGEGLMKLTDLTAEELKSVLHYDPETGVFTRLGGPRKGKAAGSVDSWGHRQIRIYGRLYTAGRPAWLYMTGEWPSEEVDHENVLPADDRWENLRLASHSENVCNQQRRCDNTSGHKGVYWHGSSGMWQASIGKGNKLIYLGLFKTKEEAIRVRLAAVEKMHGDFARQ